MSKNTTSRTSSTASNNSSSDSGKRSAIFLKDIPKEYKNIYDNPIPIPPSNFGGSKDWKEWKDRIERAHVFECLARQHLQNMKPSVPKLKVTQYYDLTPSLERNCFTFEQFKRRVSYHKNQTSKHEIVEEAERLFNLESSESESESGPTQDEENQEQLRESRSKTLLNSPDAQKKHFEGLIIAWDKGIGSARKPLKTR